ncbi:MAG: 4-(cytidine 5'-diphospho)-2-C-methyl-D-erythritol kinase, partial [Pseudomonadota bacterium]
LKGMPNDLEAPAATLCPDITTVLDTLRQQAGAALCRMSGSGATCFALFRDDDEAKTAAGVIADAHPRWWVAATRLRGSAT